MASPALLLGAALVAGVALVFLFWPVRGLAWRWSHAWRAGERVLVEDALKHLWDCQYREVPATLQSLAGALGLPGNRAAELAGRLEQLDLLISRDGAWALTPEGRRQALRVIRIHRLWERYLSDRTGLDASEWHAHAEVREHRTSEEQAAEMAASMGHPRYDPHGDPIPTAGGDVPAQRGEPLTALPVGGLGEIVHVEDEPQAVYDQILAAGLHPGMPIRVLESTAQRLRVEAEAEEYVLAPIVAANVTVIRLDADATHVVPAGVERLSSLAVGESGEVTGISAACRGAVRQRLLDLGIVPGTVVEPEMLSPSGDPVAYRVRGALIALRRAQAEQIHVQRVQRGAA